MKRPLLPPLLLSLATCAAYAADPTRPATGTTVTETMNGEETLNQTPIISAETALDADPSAIGTAEPGPAGPAAVETLEGAPRPIFSREDFDNPIVRVETTMGVMILELFPQEAPLTVANFIGLAEGSRAFIDPATGLETMRPFYDGLLFHRVIDDFMIQGGSPTGRSDGTPGYGFRDEINAYSLGLDKIPALNAEGIPHPLLGIRNQGDFQQKVLAPLYRQMRISSQAELEADIESIERRLRGLSVKESFENLGYRYTETVISRMPLRGVIAMANSGPDSNGSQFFITLVDTDWLAGRHTVFGKVRAGLEVLDAIGGAPVDDQSRPLEDVVIVSIRRLRE